ncbi:alpha/beta family hydrolase [Spiribacter halobius]|uniref:Alpha/beta hydrolase n=1 Tax=Sediminicurvatus halobius TaxID=2182432 RepID=A0A2U2N3Z4_9GAMM|nr:alpha/beta family hydrolase [Spiribacter halobius]PWG63768.1 alpha/beta hydrolase [Spiribacter halobius]UEX76251.1 alpha/beta fold hydrolase [Spiribacter halobius]
MDTPAHLDGGPPDGVPVVLLAHGAGVGMEAPLLQAIADGLAGAGCRVRRFEFPYMQRVRATGRRRPPDPERTLLQAWRDAATQLRAETPAPLVVGGKSLGGRMASLVAEELRAAGLLCLGYPFHPPGRPERERTAHLSTLTVPTLILQGERDAFGSRAEVAGYRLAPSIRIAWLPDGDHDFRPRRQSGVTLQDNYGTAVAEARAFCQSLAPPGMLRAP